MDPIKDRKQAARMLTTKGHGSIRRKDGTVVSGLHYNTESPADDPNGIGSFLFKLKDGTLDEVTFDEFDALVDAW